MKKALFVFMAATVLLMSGCTKENNETEKEPTSTPVEQPDNQGTEDDTADKNPNKTTEPKGYVFDYNGVKVGMDMEAAPIIAALGEPSSYFEAPSCAFEGLDKNYNYGSFEIDTYEQDGKDYISTVFFCDEFAGNISCFF